MYDLFIDYYCSKYGRTIHDIGSYQTRCLNIFLSLENIVQGRFKYTQSMKTDVVCSVVTH